MMLTRRSWVDDTVGTMTGSGRSDPTEVSAVAKERMAAHATDKKSSRASVVRKYQAIASTKVVVIHPERDPAKKSAAMMAATTAILTAEPSGKARMTATRI